MSGSAGVTCDFGRRCGLKHRVLAEGEKIRPSPVILVAGADWNGYWLPILFLPSMEFSAFLVSFLGGTRKISLANP